MPICMRCGQGFEVENPSCPRCGLPQGAAWGIQGSRFSWLCLTVGQITAAVVCGLIVLGTLLSLIDFKPSLLLRALGVEVQGGWRLLGVLAEGALGFCFWAGMASVFSRAKRMPEV